MTASSKERDEITTTELFDALCWLQDAINGLRAAVFHPQHRHSETEAQVKRALAEADTYLTDAAKKVRRKPMPPPPGKELSNGLIVDDAVTGYWEPR